MLTHKSRFVLMLLIFALLAVSLGCETADIAEDREAIEISVPGDFETIEEAVEAAQSGDTIIVSPGTYEGFDFMNKKITVRSTDPDDPDVVASTIIEGEVSSRQHETNETVLKGFTISNSPRYGVYITGRSEKLVTKNVIKDSTRDGIYIQSSPQITSPTIKDNVIENNQGGAIYIGTSSPVITDNIIRNNNAPENGAIWSYSSHPTLIGNTIVDNVGSGVYFERFSSGVVVDNVFENNVAADKGGAMYVSRPTDLEDLDGNPIELEPGEVDELNIYGTGDRANQPDDIFFAIWEED